LALGWHLYASESNDVLVQNVPGNQDPLGPHGSWCDGWESWQGSNSDNTNTIYLTRARLGDYLARSTGIFNSGAVAMSFADGHAGVHKWVEGSTILPVKQVNIVDRPPAPKSRDIQWMVAHSTAPVGVP
jgi:prepilin-type processing-associated H-X9-DG protein